jgi:glycosyltransferase involved in cell wall biosynthesis
VAWLAAWARTGVPSVHVLHGYEDITREGDIASFVVRQVSRLIQRLLGATFVTVSDSMRAVAAKFFAVDASYVQAVPNGIDLTRFPFCDDKPSDHFTILMLGTLSPNKGQRVGIQAFRKLLERFPEAKLLIVGEGADRALLQAKIGELALEKAVKLAGRQDDVSAVFANTHLLWQLSESEAMPMVVLEAMASGVPVVGFDVRGTRDAVAQGETGLLVPYGDIEGVVEKSIDLLSNETDYRRLASNGRERVEQFFAYDAMVDGHERVFLSKS